MFNLCLHSNFRQTDAFWLTHNSFRAQDLDQLACLRVKNAMVIVFPRKINLPANPLTCTPQPADPQPADYTCPYQISSTITASQFYGIM